MPGSLVPPTPRSQIDPQRLKAGWAPGTGGARPMGVLLRAGPDQLQRVE